MVLKYERCQLNGDEKVEVSNYEVFHYLGSIMQKNDEIKDIDNRNKTGWMDEMRDDIMGIMW